MLNQPTSSPMMTTMFGFLPGAWADAGPASSATTAISASKVEQILMVLRILASSLDCTRFILQAPIVENSAPDSSAESRSAK